MDHEYFEEYKIPKPDIMQKPSTTKWTYTTTPTTTKTINPI
jgi:hypothetical protein